MYLYAKLYVFIYMNYYILLFFFSLENDFVDVHVAWSNGQYLCLFNLFALVIWISFANRLACRDANVHYKIHEAYTKISNRRSPQLA